MVFTRLKLRETEYFLQRLLDPQEGPEYHFEKFQFHLSAFLSAWKSTWEYLLKDFGEHYFHGFSRDELRWDKFKLIARASENEEALEFIDWYNKKFDIVGKHPLWNKRVEVAHDKYPDIKVKMYEMITSESAYVADLIYHQSVLERAKLWGLDINGKMDEPIDEPFLRYGVALPPREVDKDELLKECREGFQIM
jgi:hypothetical protein